MDQEKRPTCVTVIGWVWIILGGLMCLSGTMALFDCIMLDDMAQDDPDTPFVFAMFPLLAVVLIALSVLALIAGIHFLKRRPWARTVLECLTWLLLVYVVGFMIFMLCAMLLPLFGHHQLDLRIIGARIMAAVVGMAVCAMYGVPLAIMLRFLRGDRVRNAMIGAADQRAAGAGAAPPQALSPEAKTHLQKRPTCVSVIGWAWIIIGVNLFLSCVLGLSAWLMIGAMSETELDRPFFRILPLICVLLLAMAVSGLVAGVHFLRLKAWARTVLEVLTWLFLVYTTAFIVFWLIGWFAATSGYGPRDPGEIIGAVIGVIIAAGYGVPFIIMLKYLRGDTVRNAIAGGRDPVGSPICQ